MNSEYHDGNDVFDKNISNILFCIKDLLKKEFDRENEKIIEDCTLEQYLDYIIKYNYFSKVINNFMLELGRYDGETTEYITDISKILGNDTLLSGISLLAGMKTEDIKQQLLKIITKDTTEKAINKKNNSLEKKVKTLAKKVKITHLDIKKYHKNIENIIISWPATTNIDINSYVDREINKIIKNLPANNKKCKENRNEKTIEDIKVDIKARIISRIKTVNRKNTYRSNPIKETILNKGGIYSNNSFQLRYKKALLKSSYNIVTQESLFGTIKYGEEEIKNKIKSIDTGNKIPNNIYKVKRKEPQKDQRGGYFIQRNIRNAFDNKKI